MKYQEMFREENEAVLERYQLTMERIASMKEEQTVTEPYRVYFNRVADFILMIFIVTLAKKALFCCIDTDRKISFRRYFMSEGMI